MRIKKKTPTSKGKMSFLLVDRATIENTPATSSNRTSNIRITVSIMLVIKKRNTLNSHLFTRPSSLYKSDKIGAS